MTMTQISSVNPSLQTKAGFEFSDFITAETRRYSTPSTGLPIVDPLLNRLLTYRERPTTSTIPNGDISRTVDLGEWISAKGGNIDDLQGFGSTTRRLTTRIYENRGGMWNAEGELWITGERAPRTPQEYIVQAKSDAALKGTDWFDEVQELSRTGRETAPVRISDVRRLSTTVTEGTTIPELLELQPNVPPAGAGFRANKVNAADFTNTLNTDYRFGRGDPSVTQITRDLIDTGRSEHGNLLTNTYQPISRIMDLIHAQPEWQGMGSPEYAGFFNERGLLMTRWERGQPGVSGGANLHADLQNSLVTFDRGNVYDLHTHTYYPLSHWLSGRMGAHPGTPEVVSGFMDAPLLGRYGKLGQIYLHELLPRAEYYKLKAGIERQTVATAPSVGDLQTYGANNPATGVGLKEALIAHPQGMLDVPRPNRGWGRYQQLADALEQGVDSEVAMSRLGLPDFEMYGWDYYRGSPYVRAEAGTVSRLIQTESAPFTRFTNDALMREMRGNPLEEYWVKQPRKLTVNVGVGGTAPTLTPQAAAVSGSQKTRGTFPAQQKGGTATVENVVGYIPASAKMVSNIKPSGSFNPPVAGHSAGSPAAITLSGVVQPQSNRQRTKAPVALPQFLRPQVQNVRQGVENVVAYIPISAVVQDKAKQEDQDRLTSIMQVSAAARKRIPTVGVLPIQNQIYDQIPAIDQNQKIQQDQKTKQGIRQDLQQKQIQKLQTIQPVKVIPFEPVNPVVGGGWLPSFGGGGSAGGSRVGGGRRLEQLFRPGFGSVTARMFGKTKTMKAKKYSVSVKKTKVRKTKRKR